MVLSDNDIRSKIAQPLMGVELKAAYHKELRIAALCNGENKSIILHEYAAMFSDEVKPIVHNYFDMLAMPFLAVDSGTVYSHFQKINYTQSGRQISYNFEEESEFIDWLDYLTTICSPDYKNKLEGIHLSDFFGKSVLDTVLYAPNSKILIDIGDNNDPYLQLIYTKHIHDYYETVRGAEYLIVAINCQENGDKSIDKNFQTPADHVDYYVYDDKYSQVWRSKNGNVYLVNKYEHNFSKCPVKSVSQYSTSITNLSIKKSPITDSYTDIWNYTLIANIYNHYHWQKGSPPSIGIEKDCDYIDPYTQSPCNNRGQIIIDLTTSDDLDGIGKRGKRILGCPACADRQKKKATLGKEISVKESHVFLKGDEINAKLLEALRTSLGHIDVNTDYLTFGSQWLPNKQMAIEADIMGRGFTEMLAKSAEGFNTEQLKLSTDGKKSNLDIFANHIENLHKWAINNVCKSRYNSFVSCSVFYGRDYYLKDAAYLQEELKELILNNGNQFLITKKSDELIRSLYRYNQDELDMAEVLNIVIPYQDMPIEKFLQVSTYLPEDLKQRRIYAGTLLPLFQKTYWASIREMRFNNKVTKAKNWFDKEIKNLKSISENNGEE